MKVKYYPNLFLNFLIFLVLFESYISTQEFYDNVKYDFGHWVIYEMNVGAFTTEGTFNAAAQKLEDLKSLGIDIIWLCQYIQEMVD